MPQAPPDRTAHPEAHAQLEVYPAHHMSGRLESVAGSEPGAGMLTADGLPEFAAAELQQARVER